MNVLFSNPKKILLSPSVLSHLPLLPLLINLNSMKLLILWLILPTLSNLVVFIIGKVIFSYLILLYVKLSYQPVILILVPVVILVLVTPIFTLPKILSGPLFNTTFQPIASCPDCQIHKSSTAPPSGLLNPIPRHLLPWSQVSLNFISGLPLSKKFDYILVVKDHLTKLAHFIPCQTTNHHFCCRHH
jgi:hypothetical protein